jgi:SAM-dependent methyltransferase
MEGKLSCTSCGVGVAIIRCPPRFVSSESYALSFGFQWNRFDKLQVDAVMRNGPTRDRFYATTGWPTRMEGQVIPKAGCGAGRLTLIALETGADVVSFDLSLAIEAASRNNAGADRLCMFQAGIY